MDRALGAGWANTKRQTYHYRANRPQIASV
jgi:hypothetical protein